jgi:hypothetical protein
MRSKATRRLGTILANTAAVGFVLALVGCAHLGGLSPVVVSDVKSVTGTWKGVVYGSNSTPESIALTIGDDGVYDVVVSLQPVGESRSRGQVTVRDGRLLFEGPRGRGMGTLLANSAGDRIMNIEATLSDNTILSARLAPSGTATK